MPVHQVVVPMLAHPEEVEHLEDFVVDEEGVRFHVFFEVLYGLQDLSWSR